MHLISNCHKNPIRIFFFHDYLYFFDSVIFVVVIIILVSNTYHIAPINRFYAFVAFQKLDEALDVLRYLNSL